MASYIIQYHQGDTETMIANQIRELGEWLVFTDSIGEVARRRAHSIERITRN